MNDRHDHGPDDTADLSETERRLRVALDHRAGAVTPDPLAFTRIEEQLMPSPRLSDAQRWILGGVAAVAGLLVVVIVLVSSMTDDDRGDVASGPPTDTSSTTEATTSTTTTEAPLFVSPVDPFAVAFPSPADSRRFDDATAAAKAYATDVLGFTRMIVGDNTPNGRGTATVEVSDRVDGRVTAIEVFRHEDGAWYVTGSTTEDIVVTTPTAQASLATPFETTGRALAFEGTVDVVVRLQGRSSEVGSGFVTGSGTPPAGPFDGRIFFSPPPEASAGVLIYRTLSAEDGHVEQATSFPVRLTNVTSPTTADACGDTSDDDSGVDDARVVKVFFHCDPQFETTVAVRRLISADDPAILANTIQALLNGPSDSEAEAGFSSVFPVEGGVLERALISDGVATIELSAAFADQMPNASATILAFRQEVFRTATQFSTVAAVEVLFGGSCETYAEWAQTDSCLITE